MLKLIKTPNVPQAEREAHGSSNRMLLSALSLNMLMPSLDTSIANSSLPTLAQAFNVSFQQVQWVVLAYLLTITASIVSVGRLGDLVGRRRLLLSGICFFTAASVIGGLAPNLWVLISARAVQGLAAAIMMALAVALTSENLPQSKIGSAMGLLSTMSAVGTTLGPSLGGILMSTLNWRAVFLLNLPLGIINLLLVVFYLPKDRARKDSSRARFDLAGTALLATALATYSLAMTIGRGDFNTLSFSLLFIAVFALVIFIFVESKVASPLIQLKNFRNLVLTASLIMSALVSTVIMSSLVVGPFYLTWGLGLAPSIVGLSMSAGPLVAALSGIPSGWIVDRYGPNNTSILGLIGMTVGTLMLSSLREQSGILGYLIPITVLTSSYALFQAANNTLIMRDVASDQRGVISGLLSLSRNLGLISGASLMGAVFTFASQTSTIKAASPALVALGMRTTFAVATFIILSALITAIVSRNFSLSTPILEKQRVK